MRPIPFLYFCAYYNCNASFRNKTKYDIHTRTHSKERPFLCSFEDCQKNFASPSHLKRHALTHEEPLKCSFEGCQELFKTKATLKKHIEFFHEKKIDKKYKCTICDEQFSKHNWLQRHMFRHNQTYPHVCPVEDCKKGFLLPSRLKRHMKIHKGYPCKQPGCDMVLSKWSLYVKHQKEIHPRVYTCDVCSKVFAHSSNLKAHKQIHAEEREVFPCKVPKCNRYYYQMNNLNYHMRRYHRKRPFMCSKDLCSKAFKTQKQLDEHILYHDKKKPRKKNIISKPSFAAKLAGCVKSKQVNRRDSYQTCESIDKETVLALSDENSILASDKYTPVSLNKESVCDA